MRQPPFKIGAKIRKGRKSAFREVGLEDEFKRESSSSSAPRTSPKRVSFVDEKQFDDGTGVQPDSSPAEKDNQSQLKRHGSNGSASRQHQRRMSLQSKSWYSKLGNNGNRPRVQSTSGAPPGTVSGVQRFALIAVLIAIVLPALSYRKDNSLVVINGADAGPVRKRLTSPAEVCTRWAQQVAFLNGTLYIYGGEATTSQGQDSNTWNNDFLMLDLTQNWDASSPPLTGLAQPEGPPPVALGYLWHDYQSLYLYGGEFSTAPYVDPWAPSVWEYAIRSGGWSEISNPTTSDGNYSAPAGEPVNRAAEGAGISVPELGLSWYFGGHLDWATTPGWSTDTKRVYLKSLLEFTHPGYVNSGVYDLSGGTGAGEYGAFRNITQGGVQANEFPERADGVLVYVPGWGPSGVLIGLAGGTAAEFTHDLGTLDVYDIASSEWYHQSTTGDTPGVRVNPCAVIASAPDASSFQIYMFGGQNLQPAVSFFSLETEPSLDINHSQGDQIQYNDMYILTIPSFTWIKVDQSDQNVPQPRAGHTCTMQDSQMVVVGGYIGADKPCDSPGIYVFDATSLQWQDRFLAGDHAPDYHPDNSVLAGSYGYSVPDAVQSVIGGDGKGGATATAPAAGAGTDGPFATGRAPIFTVTDSGATATVIRTAGGSTATSPPNNDASPTSTSSGSSSGVSATDAGLISAGVVAGLAGVVALYLGFCAWLYRRQVGAYRRHLAAVNHYSGVSQGSFGGGAAAAAAFERRQHPHQHQRLSSHSSEMEQQAYGWPGSQAEPSWLAESSFLSGGLGPSPSSGSGSGSGGAYGGGGGGDHEHNSGEETGPDSGGDGSESTDGLLEGQEPSFFSVVMGPRRALRVVNGVE